MAKEDDKKKDDEKEEKNKKLKQGEESAITETAKGGDKDFKGSAIEGTKDAEEEGKDKGYVTGEDAIKILRNKGYKI